MATSVPGRTRQTTEKLISSFASHTITFPSISAICSIPPKILKSLHGEIKAEDKQL